jgi:hypothetical protein
VKVLFESLMRFFRGRSEPSARVQTESRSDLARRLVAIIERTQPDECTCEETYALIDEFTEALGRGEDVSSLMPLVERHLEICADCREEFEALLRVIQATPNDLELSRL